MPCHSNDCNCPRSAATLLAAPAHDPLTLQGLCTSCNHDVGFHETQVVENKGGNEQGRELESRIRALERQQRPATSETHIQSWDREYKTMKESKLEFAVDDFFEKVGVSVLGDVPVLPPHFSSEMFEQIKDLGEVQYAQPVVMAGIRYAVASQSDEEQQALTVDGIVADSKNLQSIKKNDVVMQNGNIFRLCKKNWLGGGRLQPDYSLDVHGSGVTSDFSCLVLGESDDKKSMLDRGLSKKHKGQNLQYQEHLLVNGPRVPGSSVISFLLNGLNIQFFSTTHSKDSQSFVHTCSTEVSLGSEGWKFFWSLLNASATELGYKVPDVKIGDKPVQLEAVLGSGHTSKVYLCKVENEEVAVKIANDNTMYEALKRERKILGMLGAISATVLEATQGGCNTGLQTILGELACFYNECSDSDVQSLCSRCDLAACGEHASIVTQFHQHIHSDHSIAAPHAVTEEIKYRFDLDGAREFKHNIMKVPELIAYGEGILVTKPVGKLFVGESQYNAPVVDFGARHVKSLFDLVSHLHSCDILYRDFNPRHVLSCGDGTMTLIDWGYACLISDEKSQAFSVVSRFTHPDILTAHTNNSAAPKSTKQHDVHALVKTVYALIHPVFYWKLMKTSRDEAAALWVSEGFNDASNKWCAYAAKSDINQLDINDMCLYARRVDFQK